MKNVSVKKIVLSSIGLFSGIMLFVSLSFRLIFFKMAGLSDSASSAVSGTLGWEANGFTMLSFKLPEVLRASMLTYLEEDFCKIIEVLFAISSWLILAYSIASVIFTVLCFFRSTPKKNEKVLTWLLVGSLIFAVVHSVLGIVFTAITQANMKEMLDGAYSIGNFATAAYASIIIQAICFIGYLVCLKVLKEPQVVVVGTEEKTAETKKESSGDKAVALKELISLETEIVNILSEYKGLYDAQIISTADYMDKKVKLLRYTETRVKTAATKLVEKSSCKGVVDAESEVVCILKEYAKLLKDNVISDSDFIEKKISLLNYVIS